MNRFSIALAAILSFPVASWGEDVGFNNLRGASTCLRSIAYRASCPIAGDNNCISVWIASLRLCRSNRTTNYRTYRLALKEWRFMKFVEDDNRKHRWECSFEAGIGRLEEDVRRKREGADDTNVE
jgi:hypothetical protein